MSRRRWGESFSLAFSYFLFFSLFSHCAPFLSYGKYHVPFEYYVKTFHPAQLLAGGVQFNSISYDFSGIYIDFSEKNRVFFLEYRRSEGISRGE